MTQARTKFLRILYITLLLNMACAAGEDEANTAYEKSKVVVFRTFTDKSGRAGNLLDKVRRGNTFPND